MDNLLLFVIIIILFILLYFIYSSKKSRIEFLNKSLDINNSILKSTQSDIKDLNRELAEMASASQQLKKTIIEQDLEKKELEKKINFLKEEIDQIKKIKDENDNDFMVTFHQKKEGGESS